MALTLQEASKVFGIPVDKLRQYEKNGLLQNAGSCEKTDSYEDDDFRQLGLACLLLDAGFTQPEVKKYLELVKDDKTTEEQIRMLRKQRGGYWMTFIKSSRFWIRLII